MQVQLLAVLHKLHFALDPHLVRDQDAARLDRLIPFESPLPPIDLSTEAESRARLAPRILPATLVLAVEHDLHRRIANREITDELETIALVARRTTFDTRAAECDRRIFVRIEEIAAAQMRVPVGNASVNAGHVELCIHPRVVRVISIAAQGRLQIFEPAAHGRHHHVFDRELDARVRRIELPGGGCHRGRGHSFLLCDLDRSLVVGAIRRGEEHATARNRRGAVLGQFNRKSQGGLPNSLSMSVSLSAAESTRLGRCRARWRGRRDEVEGGTMTTVHASLEAEADASGTTSGPLSQVELDRINAYWRAANYLSVGQIYLLDNPLLRRPLRVEDVKPRLLGHWGTTPGLNFIYAHMNRVIKRDDIDAIFVAGPGHGGPGIVAKVYLEGTYSEFYPRITRDGEGLRVLCKQFSFPGGIPSHVSPETPGSINEGGELGYSLLHAYGAAFDNPDLLVCCVIGDGEAETGALATSWHSNKFLNPVHDGAVLPILHLNGYKIAGPTVLARIPKSELT